MSCDAVVFVYTGDPSTHSYSVGLPQISCTRLVSWTVIAVPETNGAAERLLCSAGDTTIATRQNSPSPIILLFSYENFCEMLSK